MVIITNSSFKVEALVGEMMKRCEKTARIPKHEFQSRARGAATALGTFTRLVQDGELERHHHGVRLAWKKARFVVHPLHDHLDKRASQSRALQSMRSILFIAHMSIYGNNH